MAAMRRETSALPSCMLCNDVSLCLGLIIGANSVDFCVECFIMTPFGCLVTRTSHAVMCISTETRKNVTNHRGQSQNKQSGFERTCHTCVPNGNVSSNWILSACVLVHVHIHRYVCTQVCTCMFALLAYMCLCAYMCVLHTYVCMQKHRYTKYIYLFIVQ